MQFDIFKLKDSNFWRVELTRSSGNTASPCSNKPKQFPESVKQKLTSLRFTTEPINETLSQLMNQIEPIKEWTEKQTRVWESQWDLKGGLLFGCGCVHVESWGGVGEACGEEQRIWVWRGGGEKEEVLGFKESERLRRRRREGNGGG